MSAQLEEIEMANKQFSSGKIHDEKDICQFCTRLESNPTLSSSLRSVNHLWSYLYHQNVREALIPCGDLDSVSSVPMLTFTLSVGPDGEGTGLQDMQPLQICENCSLEFERLEKFHQQLKTVQKLIQVQVKKINQIIRQQKGLEAPSLSSTTNSIASSILKGPRMDLSVGGTTVGKENIAHTLKFLNSVLTGLPVSSSSPKTVSTPDFPSTTTTCANFPHSYHFSAHIKPEPIDDLDIHKNEQSQALCHQESESMDHKTLLFAQSHSENVQNNLLLGDYTQAEGCCKLSDNQNLLSDQNCTAPNPPLETSTNDDDVRMDKVHQQDLLEPDQAQYSNLEKDPLEHSFTMDSIVIKMEPVRESLESIQAHQYSFPDETTNFTVVSLPSKRAKRQKSNKQDFSQKSNSTGGFASQDKRVDTCPKCNADLTTFKKMKSRYRHLRECTNGPQFKCHYCSVTFSRRYGLKRHVQQCGLN